MPGVGRCGGNHAALGNLDDVIAERFRHGVQRQRAVDKALDEFETAQGALLVVIDDAETFAAGRLRHEWLSKPVGNRAPTSAAMTFPML